MISRGKDGCLFLLRGFQCVLYVLLNHCHRVSGTTVTSKQPELKKQGVGMEGDAHGQDFSVLSASNEFSEEYEVLETTVPSSNQLWVDPSILKLLHRIGRGPFGDTWLATIHNSTKDFDEFHEVVVKMLPDAREHLNSLLRRFQSTYQHAEVVKGVCWPQGISIKNGRVSIMLRNRGILIQLLIIPFCRHHSLEFEDGVLWWQIFSAYF